MDDYRWPDERLYCPTYNDLDFHTDNAFDIHRQTRTSYDDFDGVVYNVYEYEDIDTRGWRGPAKLSENIVKAILNSPEMNRTLAKKYGVSEQTISHARTGRSWKPVYEHHIALRAARGRALRLRSQIEP